MANFNGMRFDAVHDTQRIYRALLDAMSFPGTVREIGPAVCKLDGSAAACPAAAGIALTLLDGEVSHAVRMTEATALSDYIRKMTFSPSVPPEQADYVFADGWLEEAEIRSLFERISRGTHEAPELGATLLLRVSGLGGSGERKWTLSGPGIADSVECCVAGLNERWLFEREKANAEYPVGVDMILFTDDGLVTALPRTTTIGKGEPQWLM